MNYKIKNANLTSFSFLFLQVILVNSMIYFVPAHWGNYEFPFGIQVLGWLLLVSSVIVIPLGMIYALVANSDCERNLLGSSPDFCPAHVRQQRQSKNVESAICQVNSAYVSTEEQVEIFHL